MLSGLRFEPGNPRELMYNVNPKNNNNTYVITALFKESVGCNEWTSYDTSNML
jgi:hypothetical protein